MSANSMFDPIVVGPLVEDMAARIAEQVAAAETELARLRDRRRHVARLLIDMGYTRADTARLVGVTDNGLTKMLSRTLL